MPDPDLERELAMLQLFHSRIFSRLLRLRDRHHFNGQSLELMDQADRALLVAGTTVRDMAWKGGVVLPAPDSWECRVG